MDLTKKIQELSELYEQKRVEKAEIHEEMKLIKKKIAKYEALWKLANEIDPEDVLKAQSSVLTV